MKCSQLKFGWLNTLTGETKTHDFALGLGPCGRWVTELTVEIDLATVRVVQASYATERHSFYRYAPEVKHFVYRLEDIRGRITAL